MIKAFGIHVHFLLIVLKSERNSEENWFKYVLLFGMV